MHNVLVDLYKLGGNKYNGLYHFCYQLGHHLAALPRTDDLDLSLYVPASSVGLFGNQVQYAVQKSRDKFYRFGTRKYDVWHVATTLSWYRPFNKQTRNVFTVHDLNFMEEPEYSTKSRKRYMDLIKQRINRADHLTFISRFALEQTKQYADIGNKPYSIVYNGCNIPTLGDVKASPGYQPAAPFLFSIGQLHWRKNFHVLPALLKGNDLELVIAGLNNFPYRETVMAAAKQYGVENRVKLVGAVTEAEKYWYYQNCKAFVFPSIGEGFGLPVLEAMHFGKPVFLSSYTSLPEVGGDAAYYFNDFDPAAMQLVFEQGMQHYRATQPAERIKQHAAGFSWQKAAREYITVYRSLL